MPARKLYDDTYERSLKTAKKYNSNYIKIAPKRKNVKTGKNKLNTKQKRKAKNNASAIAFILSVFAMTLILTYRFNMISEKNLEVQNLKKELNKVESGLVSSQIDVEQGTDLNKIEAYAKQQLGMQKPDKNQTIYVDTSIDEGNTQVEKTLNVFEKIVENIKDAIAKIF